MDVIRLIQKSYKNSLASSKVLNCLSCGRGDAKFEESPLYIKTQNNQFFVNKLPNSRSRQARFKKPRGQSAYVINHRIKNMGQSMNLIKKNQNDGKPKINYFKENKRPQTGIPKMNSLNEVDYGKFIRCPIYS